MHNADAPMLTGARARRILPLADRAGGEELLDAGNLQPSELRTNLDDLARLNRLPGGRRASVRAAQRLTGGVAGSVIDVGTGRGDIAAAFAGRGWEVTAVDVDDAVLAVARDALAAQPRVAVELGDARALPFEERTFDVAHSSLLLHHLDPPDAVRALREMRRVARRGVVVNDLRRGVLPLVAVATSVAVLGRCRTTRHDGILSVRRAYSNAELERLLHAAGLEPVHRSPAVMPRLVTVAVPAR